MSIVCSLKLKDYLSFVSVMKCVVGIEFYYYDMVMDFGLVVFMISDWMVGKVFGIFVFLILELKICVWKLFLEIWFWFNKIIGYVEVDLWKWKLMILII